MRGATDADLAAFHEINTRGAGLHANVAAAAQDGFYLAVGGFDGHGTGDVDGFSFDDADGVGNVFIRAGARCGGCDQGGAKDYCARDGSGGAAAEF
jgi:hypothetical protein